MSEESTTPDLVKLLARLREAVNRRDFDKVMSVYAPDAVFQGTELGTFEGAGAIRGFYEDAVTSYEEIHVKAEEVIDLGNGVTLAVLIAKGRPVGSSGEVRRRWAAVAIWTNGVVKRLVVYRDRDRALTDLGLKE